MPGFRLVMRTDKGDREQNQDALDVLRLGEWVVCALADGAGGHHGGEVASRYSIACFMDLFRASPTQDPEQLRNLLQQVNHYLLAAQQNAPALADMHSTFCALVFNQGTGKAVCLHVGDSRIYHFRQNRLVFRTRDHSMLQWMQDHQQHPSDCNRNTLYSALGEETDQLQVDVSPVFNARPGDWFLLCSDGLWEHFSDDELGLMGSNLRLQPECCMHIHQVALGRAQGRADNLSSILLFMAQEDTQSGPCP